MAKAGRRAQAAVARRLHGRGAMALVEHLTHDEVVLGHHGGVLNHLLGCHLDALHARYEQLGHLPIEVLSEKVGG